jgi:hypothetical protein
LPVPLSPSSITEAEVGATFSMLRHTFSMPGSREITPASGESACDCCMRRFSCCSACRKKARWITSPSISGSHGFWWKS